MFLRNNVYQVVQICFPGELIDCYRFTIELIEKISVFQRSVQNVEGFVYSSQLLVVGAAACGGATAARGGGAAVASLVVAGLVAAGLVVAARVVNASGGAAAAWRGCGCSLLFMLDSPNIA